MLDNTDTPSVPSTTVANGASTLRAAVIGFGGYLIGKGYLSADLVHALEPVVLIVAPLVWAYFKNHSTTNTVRTLKTGF